MFGLRVWFFPVLAALLTGFASFGDEPPKVLEQVANAYAGGHPLRFTFDQFTNVPNSSDPEVRAGRLSLPGMRTFVHPESGVELFAELDGTMIMDGRDGLRVERERRTQRRPATEKQSGRARNYDLWTSTELVHHSEMNGDVVDLIPLGDISPGAIRAKRLRGEMTPDRLRGQYSVLHLVRWALEGLRDASDLTVGRPESNTTTLSSESTGLRLTVDSHTFEVCSLVYASPNGNTYEWRWEGTIPGAAYPARQPERQFHLRRPATSSARDAASTTDYGDVLWFTSEAPDPECSPREFDWRSVGSFAYDKKHDVVVDSDGRVDQQRTNARKQFTGYQAASGAAPGATAAGPVGTVVAGANSTPTRPWWVAVSVAAVLCAGAVWWRRTRAQGA